MSKRLWLALCILASAFLIAVLGARAQAWTTFRSGNTQTVAAGETLDTSLWVGAKNVDIAGTVDGDVFCGAQTLNISGTVKGDVICGAMTINISGNIEGNVRLAGQTINLNGTVARNATIAGGTINTDPKSRIGQDANLAGNDLNLGGVIGRDLSAAGKDLSLSGTVGRDLKTTGDQITLTTGAKVGGGLEYTSKHKISLASATQVGGKITQHLPKEHHRQWVKLIVFGGVFGVIVAIMLVVSAVVITALLPQLLYRVSQQGISRPWLSLLVGFSASVLVPVLFIVLIASIVGIPLAILVLLSWLVINLSSGLFSAFLAGRWALRGRHNAVLIALAGSLILVILYFIPIVGIIALVLAAWMGEGMLILEIKSHIHRPVYKTKKIPVRL